MSDMHFPTRAVCAACDGGRCTYIKASDWTDVLDRAYAEWREAGFPAGEGVVHLWRFQRLGLWRPQTAIAMEFEMRDPSQTSTDADVLPADRAATPSAPTRPEAGRG